MVVSCSFIVCDSILSCHCCPFYKVITDTCNNFLTWFSYVIRWCVVCIKDDGSVICLPIYWRARSRRTIVRSPAVDNIDPIRTSNKLRWIRFTEEHLFTRGFRNIKKKKEKGKKGHGARRSSRGKETTFKRFVYHNASWPRNRRPA